MIPLIAALLIMSGGSASAQIISNWCDGSEDDVILECYYPGMGWMDDYSLSGSEVYDTSPDQPDFGSVWASGLLPKWGYPYHSPLIKGLNDTLQLSITFSHLDQVPFSLPEAGQWFVPRVYHRSAHIYRVPPIRSEKELGWRIRRWINQNWGSPDTINMEMVMDVWNLPLGDFVIVAFPRPETPGYFAHGRGFRFDYRLPKTAQDTINAWEACGMRAVDDGDSVSVCGWADSILAHYPTAMPGWALRRLCGKVCHDSLLETQSLETAQRALRDSTDLVFAYRSLMNPVERAYVVQMQWNIARDLRYLQNCPYPRPVRRTR